MPIYVSPEQVTKDKADYARKGISRGRPLVVVEYDQGIAFVADNPSNHLHKMAELGLEGAPNALYHISFDGTVIERNGWLAMGGQADTLSENMHDAFKDDFDLDGALRAAVAALHSVAPPE